MTTSHLCIGLAAFSLFWCLAGVVWLVVKGVQWLRNKNLALKLMTKTVTSLCEENTLLRKENAIYRQTIRMLSNPGEDD